MPLIEGLISFCWNGVKMEKMDTDSGSLVDLVFGEWLKFCLVASQWNYSKRAEEGSAEREI